MDGIRSGERGLEGENIMEREANIPLPSSNDDVIDKIVKALRLVPEFDGNPVVLTRFVALCDRLIITYVKPGPGNELAHLSLLSGILNKITGAAARTLATNGISNDWNGIRNALINSFSDHRDESALYTDLSLLTQGSDTPHLFYERVQNLLNTRGGRLTMKALEYLRGSELCCQELVHYERPKFPSKFGLY